MRAGSPGAGCGYPLGRDQQQAGDRLDFVAAGTGEDEGHRDQFQAGIALHSKVQVRAGGKAGVAGIGQPITDPYRLTRSDADRIGLQVSVHRHGAIDVQNAYGVSPALVFGIGAAIKEIAGHLHHHPGASGAHRGAQWQGDIDGVLALWMLVAEGAVERLTDDEARAGRKGRCVGLFGAMHSGRITEYGAGLVVIAPVRAEWIQAHRHGFGAGRRHQSHRQGGFGAHVLQRGCADFHFDRPVIVVDHAEHRLFGTAAIADADPRRQFLYGQWPGLDRYAACWWPVGEHPIAMVILIAVESARSRRERYQRQREHQHPKDTAPALPVWADESKKQTHGTFSRGNRAARCLVTLATARRMFLNLLAIQSFSCSVGALMAKMVGNVLIAQGGGPTAVINQSLVGAVLEARKFPEVGRVYGALHGVRGIVNENFVDLTQATTHNLERVACTPSSALLSTRDKPDAEYCERIFKTCIKYNVRFFFYVGGNDSADAVRIVNENAAAANYELRCIHIPKTIDNDLRVTDHCPGYGSAARFVSLAFAGANLDNRSLPGIYIAVVMGRNAGFLTAASALSRKYEDDGPHLVYVPERTFRKEQFLADVDQVYKRHGRCIVAVSEGIVGETGQPMITELLGEGERDAHGNVQLSGTGALGDLLADLVKAELKVSRVRADTFGYLQRSFVGIVSEVDQAEAREVGEKAAQFAIWNNVDGSVAIRRTGDYSVDYFLTPLETVARETKSMPDNFMNAAGNNVTEEFIRYARPLLGAMPEYERLMAPPLG